MYSCASIYYLVIIMQFANLKKNKTDLLNLYTHIHRIVFECEDQYEQRN